MIIITARWLTGAGTSEHPETGPGSSAHPEEVPGNWEHPESGPGTSEHPGVQGRMSDRFGLCTAAAEATGSLRLIDDIGDNDDEVD